MIKNKVAPEMLPLITDDCHKRQLYITSKGTVHCMCLGYTCLLGDMHVCVCVCGGDLFKVTCDIAPLQQFAI